MTRNPDETTWGAVVPTLGTRSSVVASVRCLLAIDAISVVAVACQGNGGDVLGWLSALEDDRVVFLESARGLSRGRNAGASYLMSLGVHAIVFLDDDCVVRGDALATAASLMSEGALAVSGRLVNADAPGQRARFPTAQTRITRRNVWRSAMESGLVLSAEFIRRYGTFEETLGVGAGTPWASGEGTELLLRGIADDARILFDPSIEIRETGLVSSVYDDDVLRKARAYARGTGRVYAIHYGLAGQASLVLRSVLRLVLGSIRRPGSARYGLQVLVGRVEGILGRCL